MWYWPVGGLGLAGEQVHSVVVEAAAHLLSNEGELTAETGHTATIPRLCSKPHSRALLVLLQPLKPEFRNVLDRL